MLDDRRARLAFLERDATELAAMMLLDLGDDAVEAHAIQHVLQARLLAIGAVAVLDERFDDASCDRHALVGGEHDAGVAGEILVTSDPPERETESDVKRKNGVRPRFHSDGGEADVV